MIPNGIEQCVEEITRHLQDWLGQSVKEATPIEKGWLNVKWKMVTDQGPLFVKYYHPDRYKLHLHPDRRSTLERALHFQHGLSEAGIPCPMVHHGDGQYLQETPSGLYYTVLDWVDGHPVAAGSMNAAQMFQLGAATGKMHSWLKTAAPADHLAWKPDKDAYLRDWQNHWDKAEDMEDRIVMEWLGRSQAIVKSMDFRMFDFSPTGWLHWDLWVDNILMQGQNVAGIVDFDRMAFAFPEIDMARAVLSGAMRDGNLQIEAVRGFMDGYRQYSEASPGLLPRALRLLYLIESIWWLRTEVRMESGLRTLLGRFVEEMHWIEDHWDNLPDL